MSDRREAFACSEAEQQARIDLAACYRLAAHYRMTDVIYTHITARVPGEPGHFLINPYGYMWEEITASSLVKIDIEGNKVVPHPNRVNPAGFTIHSAVHAAREDAGCVIHVHTPYGIAVSVQKKGLRRYTQFSMQVFNDLAYHDYEGIALELDERERIVKDLGDKSLMLLRNHGTLTLGKTCGTAFLRMYFLENACKTQILAQSVGGEEHLHEEPEEMGHKVYAQGAAAFVPGMGDNLVWPGLMRKLQRTNPGYDY